MEGHGGGRKRGVKDGSRFLALAVGGVEEDGSATGLYEWREKQWGRLVRARRLPPKAGRFGPLRQAKRSLHHSVLTSVRGGEVAVDPE